MRRFATLQGSSVMSQDPKRVPPGAAPGPTLAEQVGSESGAQARGAPQRHARGLVRPRHDGLDRLVGRGADAARRCAGPVAGSALSRRSLVDAGVADGGLAIGCLNAWHWVPAKTRRCTTSRRNRWLMSAIGGSGARFTAVGIVSMLAGAALGWSSSAVCGGRFDGARHQRRRRAGSSPASSCAPPSCWPGSTPSVRASPCGWGCACSVSCGARRCCCAHSADPWRIVAAGSRNPPCA